VVSVPNGQIAAASLESVSVRDKARFLHALGPSYDSTASQIRSVLEQLDDILVLHSNIDEASIRVNFIRRRVIARSRNLCPLVLQVTDHTS